MLLIALTIATAKPASDQILGGDAFQELASRTDALCPARRVRSITPGDLYYAQEGFEGQLSRRAQRRLQSVNTAGRRCADVNGLSCPTTATLEAMDRLGMMARFSSYLCSHPNSR